jgi:hypothetical protein
MTSWNLKRWQGSIELRQMSHRALTRRSNLKLAGLSKSARWYHFIHMKIPSSNMLETLPGGAEGISRHVDASCNSD